MWPEDAVKFWLCLPPSASELLTRRIHPSVVGGLGLMSFSIVIFTYPLPSALCLHLLGSATKGHCHSNQWSFPHLSLPSPHPP